MLQRSEAHPSNERTTGTFSFCSFVFYKRGLKSNLLSSYLVIPLKTFISLSNIGIKDTHTHTHAHTHKATTFIFTMADSPVHSNFREILQKTATAFMENNTQAVKQRNLTLLSAILTADCIRSYRPLSSVSRYPQFLKSEMTNADYEQQMSAELRTMMDVSQRVTRTVIDTEQRAAVLWAEVTLTMVDGSSKFVEVIWDLSFTEDGTRVHRILEFMDTWESTKVLEVMLAKPT